MFFLEQQIQLEENMEDLRHIIFRFEIEAAKLI